MSAFNESPPSERKVCFVSNDYPPKGGGLAVAARRVAGFLVDHGFRVHIVTCVAPEELPPGHSAAESFEDGAVIHRVGFDHTDLASSYGFRRFVRELDRRIGFDIFHGFFLPAVHSCLEAIQARGAGAARPPLIASIRGGDENGLSLNPFFLSQFIRSLKKADWVTSVNEAYLANMGRHVDLSAKSSVIRNSVPPAPLRWNLSDANRGIVGTAGQFRSEKDIPLLIRGYREVNPRLRRRLLLVGAFADAREERWSQTLIAEFGLRMEVHLTGHLPHSEVAPLLGGMHVFVQASAREGMPNALLEAASAGLPLVATDVDGIREIIRHGEDGLLVPHGRPELLGQAIESVLSDPALANRLSAGAHRLAGRFTLERERNEWLSLYERALNGRRAVELAL